ncbi:MAG TPA: hypothetical protein VKH81_05865 [Candidatus Angelobacter sp.]|nr:hypothetical protein [Candidatus Angelobacter sp.]
MQRRDEILDSRAHQNGAKPLPLFRPEAILHQQQKSYGEIILIRPLSLTLLTSLAVMIIGLAAAYLFLGSYTEKVRISGALLAKSNDNQLRAELYVPGRWLASVQPGTRLSLRCRACPSRFAEQPATVLEVSAAPSSSNDSPNTQFLEPKYKVTVTLPPRAAQMAAPPDHSPQTGVPVEAEISLGRKPLIKWLFQPSGS